MDGKRSDDTELTYVGSAKEDGDSKKMPPEDGKVVIDTDDPTKEKFLPQQASQNGEAKIDIDNGKPAFAGMDKEELLKLANDPYWVRMRWALFLLFWLLWVCMLLGAIVVIILAPRCVPPPPREWYQTNTIYEICPRSFKDSDGDGNGDFKGIVSKLPYLKDLGIKTIWLSPFYEGPQKDFGYDVTDHKKVDPIFGTMDDFRELVKEVKKKDMKIILEFVPNHSDVTNEWFMKSVRKEDPYTDYYVWVKPKRGANGVPVVPNNWISRYGGSAWKYNEERKEFYLHQFGEQEPDFNYHNPTVVKEMQGIMEFWLKEGVDGFRVANAAYLVEDDLLRDELRNPVSASKPEEYNFWMHDYTFNVDGNLEVLAQFREVLDQHEKEGEPLVLMTDANLPPREVIPYYGTYNRTISNLPFNYEFINKLGTGFIEHDLYSSIQEWMKVASTQYWATWLYGTHDQSRMASRYGQGLVDGLNMISQLLPGTPITYYGEEIGMTDVPLTFLQTRDLAGVSAGPENFNKTSRDPSRTPMQWDSTENAGFTDLESKPWLPVASNYAINNVKVQAGAEESHYKVFKQLLKLRKQDSILYGDLEYKILNNTRVFAFTRIKRGAPGYLVALNMGDTEQTANFQEFYGVPEAATVVTKSVAFQEKLGLNAHVDTRSFVLGVNNAVVLKFVPTDPADA